MNLSCAGASEARGAQLPSMQLRKSAERVLYVFRGVPGAAGRRLSLVAFYESLVLIYLGVLLFTYPYGLPLGDASIRIPDLLGLLCVGVGASILILRRRFYFDPIFLATIGPFVFLELATPILGAVGYRAPLEAVSSIRMAILWLPIVFLTCLERRVGQPAFERKFRLLLKVSLWLNVVYALLQIMSDLGLAPNWVAFTRFLQPWAVDRHFDVIVGLRPAGFFVNTTALSVFGVVCLSVFYSSYIAERHAEDLRYTLLSLFVIVLTTSRAAVAAAVLIVLVGWFALTPRRKLVVATILAIGIASLLWLVERTVGFEQAFYRFQRIADSGLLADVSFGQRLSHTWPNALRIAADYPMGTLISAPRITVLVDSGYLTYYIQGRWVFSAALAFALISMLIIGALRLWRPNHRPAGLMILFIGLYLSVSMIVTNSMRSPLLIAFLVFAFWKLAAERDGRVLRISVSRDVQG